MPRKARIDLPGLVSHVMVRGIERREIFHDEKDHQEFLHRLSVIKEDARIYAWALMPNHVHLLVRAGAQGLSRMMRRLLTGYAGYFNGRYLRVGHLFQNRYKSIVCDEDVYLKGLVRYIHLNPLKARLIPTLHALSDYPLSGHACLLGRQQNDFQDVGGALSYFGEDRAKALRTYVRFMEEGAGELYSPGVSVSRLQAGDAASDERILGEGEFVIEILNRIVPAGKADASDAAAHWEAVLGKVCRQFQVNKNALSGKGRGGVISKAREAATYAALATLGLSGQQVAEHLRISRGAVSQAFTRARNWIKGDEPWLFGN